VARGTAGSQIQTHWYYERARGQYLNDQAGMTSAKRSQFALINPRSQVVSKTDLAKVECSFELEPDIACKGAEKAFVAFAERTTKEWADESKRATYGDDWFKTAVARVILFRTAEAIISKAAWYEGGYRAQIVAYTCARLARMSLERPGSGGLDFLKIWTQQAAGDVLESQIALIAEEMARILRSPPLAGQNIGEWAKQQGCRKAALEASVDRVEGFDDWIITEYQERANKRQQKTIGRIDRGLDAVKQVLQQPADYWNSLRAFSRSKGILLPDDERALTPACQMPGMIPSDRQASRLLQLVERATDAGWQVP